MNHDSSTKMILLVNKIVNTWINDTNKCHARSHFQLRFIYILLGQWILLITETRDWKKQKETDIETLKCLFVIEF